MRTKLLLISTCALLLFGCQLTDHSERDISTEDIQFPVSGYEDVDADDLPKFTFDSTERSMGRMLQGARIDKRFTFTNSGGSPLVITDVRSTCGCTVSKDWPKQPIPPGGSGHIDVSFDSEGRTGIQHKTVTVVSNAQPRSTVLTLHGEVVGPSVD